MKTLKIEQNGLTQTIQLHDDYKVTVDDEVIMIEQKEYVPKFGDCIKARCFKFEFMGLDNNNLLLAPLHYIDTDYGGVVVENHGIESGINSYGEVEQITPEQLQEEFNKLGYYYDFTTHTASKLKWMPKKGQEYFCIGTEGKTNFIFSGDRIDNYNISINNVHKTEEDFDKFIQYLKDYEPNK